MRWCCCRIGIVCRDYREQPNVCLGSSKVTKSPQSRWQQAPILYSSGEFLPLQMSKPAGAARMVKQPPQQQRGEGGGEHRQDRSPSMLVHHQEAIASSGETATWWGEAISTEEHQEPRAG